MRPNRKPNTALIRTLTGTRPGFSFRWMPRPIFNAMAICLVYVLGLLLFSSLVGSISAADATSQVELNQPVPLRFEPTRPEPAPEPAPVVEEIPASIELPTRMPDFGSIRNVTEKKEAFFTFARPFVQEANRRIALERSAIESLQESYRLAGTLSGLEHQELERLKERYKVSSGPVSLALGELASKARPVDESIALAQAALESGWGTSRFARQGNNLFGIWCYRPGCGLVPMRRSAGARHEVRKYATLADCFEDYMRNLNASSAYADFRMLRQRGLPPYDQVDGLFRYSQEGYQYISKVKSVITVNDLDDPRA